MRLKIEAYDRSLTIETPNDDVIIEEYVDYFYTLMVGVGFGEYTIIEGFKGFVESKEE